MKSYKDHSRDFRILIVRTTIRYIYAGLSTTRCEFNSIARLKPLRIYSRISLRI